MDDLLLGGDKSVVQLLSPDKGDLWAEKLAERAHDFRNCKGVGYLLDTTKPAADICEGLRGRKSGDVLDKFRGGLEACFGDIEAQVVHFVTSKLEL